MQIRSGRAQLNVVRPGEQAGAAGAAPVVFLHAGVADHRSWSGVLDQLNPGWDVIAYDRRGFGSTTYRSQRHDQVDDLVAVLDALGLDRVVLVGNSRGGEIALNATLTHPGRIAALVLVAPAVSGAPPVSDEQVTPEEAALWGVLEAAEAAGDLEALNEGEVRFWLDGPAGAAGRVGGALRELALDMNRINLHAESAGSEPEPPDAWSRLSEVRCPALVVVGDLDLSSLQERCRELAAQIPGAELHVMEGTGHLPAFEQPERFAGVLREFLGRALHP